MSKKITFATTLMPRLRGLLFVDTFDGWLCLCPCNDVHTFGMHFALDIAFIDSRGRVVASYQKVEKSRRLKCRKAVVVLERMSCDDEFLAVGDFLELTNWRKEVLL